MKANLQSLNPNLARRTGRETVLIFLGAGIGIWALFGFKELIRFGGVGGVGGFEKESFSSTDSFEESSLISVFSFPLTSRKEEDFRRRENEENFSPTARLITETERLFFLFASERLLDIAK